MKRFPFYPQMDSMDCGPACLKMVAKYYGKNFKLSDLRSWCHLDREGVSLKGIASGAERIGFRTIAVKIPFLSAPYQPSLSVAPLPVILHWNQNHFVVAYKLNQKHVWIADPAKGKIKLDKNSFIQSWEQQEDKGVALLLEKNGSFNQLGEKIEKAPVNFFFLFNYLKPYLKLTGQIGIGLILGSLLSLIFPFLTQSIIDIGIQNQNISFIYLILLGQLFLFFSQTVVQYIQNWILLHIGTRMNVAIISDFLSKLMRLPISYFDSKMTGDLLQRINDHQRIESFLTQSTMSILFSIFNLLVFSVVLFIYSLSIFSVFSLSAILYFCWITIFLKRRREIDYKAFQQFSRTHEAQIELIHGMQEIKLQGSQLKRRWKWAEIQANLFRVQMSGLALTQYQEAGALFINQLKDIIITVLAATSVINGELTLGMMLAIQYIIGQLNTPLRQLITFVKAAQDTKISLERIGEIHHEEEEVKDNQIIPQKNNLKGDINVNNISFRYNQLSDWVLENVSLTIPEGKVTAIVGASGSGKTTLLKLLLGFYKPEKGQIKINSYNLHQLNLDYWRKQCGVVMQDGFIFSDSIANNIAESENSVNYEKLSQAIRSANIEEYIERTPLGYETTIGLRGNGLSQGQRQRLLIARSIYKNPQYLFFDEATNALDANNERVIVERLNQFFKGKTVAIVAHRLSTVKNADQIIVLDKGKVVEQGNHTSLIEKKGMYYTLVKNQLELGN